jgi:hypothetical protein
MQSVPRVTHRVPKAGGIILIHRSFVKRQVKAERKASLRERYEHAQAEMTRGNEDVTEQEDARRLCLGRRCRRQCERPSRQLAASDAMPCACITSGRLSFHRAKPDANRTRQNAAIIWRSPPRRTRRSSLPAPLPSGERSRRSRFCRRRSWCRRPRLPSLPRPSRCSPASSHRKVADCQD